MSAMLFCTTLKVDSLNELYIFSKPDPWGTDMNNMACSRLGTILHLEIKKGKEAMKTSN